MEGPWLLYDDKADPFEGGDIVSDKYQPGHVGGVLPIEDPPDYFPRPSSRVVLPLDKLYSEIPNAWQDSTID